MSFSSTEATEARQSGLLSIGTRVNQFEIRSILGEGGTAVVYEAVHTRLKSAVALKVVNMRGPDAPNAAARLRREAELCAAVEDPHVPKVYDLGALPDGTPYLVMEKVVGPTLENLLSRGRLGLRLGVLVLRDLLRAVEAVQRAGVVHRDIKPSNIIVQFGSDRTPSVRLMDFGVSRSLFFRRGSAVALTRRGMILGTPEYMAPEQIQDQLIDVRTDVYALGVVAYEMFSGRAPFEGASPADIVAAVLRREHQPLLVSRPEAPSELVYLIDRAMEMMPARRFENARAMREELEARVPRALWAQGPVLSNSAKAPAEPAAPDEAEKPMTRLAQFSLSAGLTAAVCAGILLYAQPASEGSAPSQVPIAQRAAPRLPALAPATEGAQELTATASSERPGSVGPSVLDALRASVVKAEAPALPSHRKRSLASPKLETKPKIEPNRSLTMYDLQKGRPPTEADSAEPQREPPPSQERPYVPEPVTRPPSGASILEGEQALANPPALPENPY